MIKNFYDYISNDENFSLRDSIVVVDQLQADSLLPCLISGVCPNEQVDDEQYFWITKNFRVFIGKTWAPEFNLEIQLATNMIDSSSLAYFLKATEYFNNEWSIECTTQDDTLVFSGLSPGVLQFINAPIKAEKTDPRGIVIPVKSIRAVKVCASEPSEVVFTYNNDIANRGI